MGDAVGFDCPRHGPFKVADSVFADSRTKDAEPAQWQAAFARAKAQSPPGACPLILKSVSAFEHGRPVRHRNLVMRVSAARQ
jgi:hypothetical protein